VVEFYGYNSSPSSSGGDISSAFEEFWNAVYGKKRKLWSTFEASKPDQGVSRIKELFLQAATRDAGFSTLLRAPAHSGPFDGGVTLFIHLFLPKLST
jgi:hypothetical protein